MSEELMVKDVVKILIGQDLNRIDKSIFIGSKEFSLKAYRVGVKLFRIDIQDLDK